MGFFFKRAQQPLTVNVAASRLRFLLKRGAIGGVAVGAGLGALYWYFVPRPLVISEEERQRAISWIPPTRQELLARLKNEETNSRSDSTTIHPVNKKQPFDFLIVGAGATGAGLAVDAASRGFRVACIDAGDFASGTSSKSTKLVHGGVRYLEKAIKEFDWEQYNLVREALRERSIMLRTLPHLTHSLPLMLPIYKYPPLSQVLILLGSVGGGRCRISGWEARRMMQWLGLLDCTPVTLSGGRAPWRRSPCSTRSISGGPWSTTMV